MFDSGFFGMSAAEAKTIVTWQRGLGSRERSRLMCGDLKGSDCRYISIYLYIYISIYLYIYISIYLSISISIYIYIRCEFI